MNGRIVIGVSACLAGRKVRYDGGDRLDAFLANTWGRHVDYVEFCPEAGAGLGVPREPLKLTRKDGHVAAIGCESGADRAAVINSWCDDRLEEFQSADVHGFILKSKSPSCAGDESIEGEWLEGLLAAKLARRFPFIPVADDKTVQTPEGRDLYVTRLFTLMRWRRLLDQERTRARLIAFHTAHKLLFLAHSPESYRRLGRIAANPGRLDDASRIEHYGVELLELLRNPATRGRHANVLHHIAGYFRKHGDGADRREFGQAVEDYRSGQTSLAVPLALANHQLRKHPNPFLAAQVYLHPHPLEAALRG